MSSTVKLSLIKCTENKLFHRRTLHDQIHRACGVYFARRSNHDTHLQTLDKHLPTILVLCSVHTREHRAFLEDGVKAEEHCVYLVWLRDEQKRLLDL